MKEMNAISVEELVDVTGGEIKRGEIKKVKNDTVGYAYVREEPGKKGQILGALKNGTEVETTGDVCTKDGYDWYMVHLVTGSDDAWIAGSLIGY